MKKNAEMTNINEQKVTVQNLKKLEKFLPDFQKIMEKEATYFLKKHFDLELNIPIRINSRLTRAYGRFAWVGDPRYPHNRSKELMARDFIDIQKNYILICLLTNEVETVLETLRHELVHYALFTLQKDYRDGDPTFEATLAKLGVGASIVTPRKKVVSKISRQLSVQTKFKCSCGMSEYYTVGMSRKTVRTYCSNCQRMVDLKNAKEIKTKAFNVTK